MENIDNKLNILKEALTLFSERGYETVGIQEIVEKCNITKPTLYYYFKSKKGLLQEIVIVNYKGFQTKLKEASSYNRDISLNLFKIANEYFTFAIANPEFYRLQLATSFSFPKSESYEVIYPIIKEQIDIFNELFLLASNDHGNMKGRHNAYAATFFGTINTYIKLSFDGQMELNNDIAFKAVHQFMHGIFS